MDKTNILLAGLPDSGKSTYIAALWAVENDGNSDHLLSCDGYPSDSSYIDELRNNWMMLKEVRRTVFAEPQEIVLPMKSSRTKSIINLSIPDFKGEFFQRIIENSSSELKAWCEKSSAVLFMMNLGNSSPEMLQEQISETSTNNVELEKVVMTSNEIDLAIKNVLLLKYFYNIMGDCPIAICFSLWDKIDDEGGLNVENWVKENHPCIYNYVKYHFSNYRYYGISAQGVDYSDLDGKSEDELVQKTKMKQRAYVYRDKVSYDITEPLDFLIL